MKPSPEKTYLDHTPEAILGAVQEWRRTIQEDVHEHSIQSLYEKSKWLSSRAIRKTEQANISSIDRKLDRVLTSRIWGFPIMVCLFAFMFWVTIVGANVPSAMLASALVEHGRPWVKNLFQASGSPWWITGLLVDGMYLSTAWVVSVMLPPMAIFFPVFTILEDFGFLPRVAFNMDRLFKASGAHGKQAMSMMMGFGCNAAGVVATRIIDSPRERLLAILTNNFSLCNGRWPTQILISTVFVGSLFPAAVASVVSATAVTGIALLGVMITFVSNWVLSRTLLRGEASTFSLELPPYRPPRFWQTLYTSLIDRTLFVLWRAIVFALPAGAVIWLISNVTISNTSLAEHFVFFLNPLAMILGLNGVILLAYIIAIPANEIVIPTILMLTVMVTGTHELGEGAGIMFEIDSHETLRQLLVGAGWTTLTAVNLMLFCLLHNPCSTTIFTVYKETGSTKWTVVSALLPLAMGLMVCGVVAGLWRTLN